MSVIDVVIIITVYAICGRAPKRRIAASGEREQKRSIVTQAIKYGVRLYIILIR